MSSKVLVSQTFVVFCGFTQSCLELIFEIHLQKGIRNLFKTKSNISNNCHNGIDLLMVTSADIRMNMTIFLIDILFELFTFVLYIVHDFCEYNGLYIYFTE